MICFSHDYHHNNNNVHVAIHGITVGVKTCWPIYTHESGCLQLNRQQMTPLSKRHTL